jgi:hypothetical protein
MGFKFSFTILVEFFVFRKRLLFSRFFLKRNFVFFFLEKKSQRSVDFFLVFLLNKLIFFCLAQLFILKILFKLDAILYFFNERYEYFIDKKSRA